MREDWNKSFKGSNLFYAIVTINIFDLIFSSIPKQNLCIYLLENQAWEKALIASWRKFHHGKIIGSAHSTIRFWDLRYFYYPKSYKNKLFLEKEIPDYVTINGAISEQMILENSFPPKKLVRVEAHRFNYLNQSFETNKRYKTKKNILLIGDVDNINTKSLIDTVFKINKSVKEFNYFFRPHPGSNVTLNKNLSFIKKSKNKSIIKDVKDSDIAIVSGSSSVAVEVLLMGKSLIVYYNTNLLNLSPLSEFRDINFVSTPYQLKQALLNFGKKRNYVKKDIFWLDNKLKKWKKFLQKI